MMTSQNRIKRGRVHRWMGAIRMACFCALTTTGLVLAEPAPSVEEIVTATDRVAYYLAKDGRAQVRMTITDDQGRAQRRRFTILRSDDEPRGGSGDSFIGNQKYYVYISQPADLRQSVFMVWKHLERDDDRWLYLPALDLVKRIAAGDKRTSFLGSHYCYEDISGRHLVADTHELSEVNETYYVLKNTPKDPDTVEFSYYKMWVHKQSFIPVLVEFYDRQGEKYRTYEALKVETVDDYPTVVKSRMTDLATGGHTVLEFSRVVYNLGLPDEIFTERYLRKAPRRYLR